MSNKLVVSKKTILKWSDGCPQLSVPPYNKKITDFSISIIARFLESFASPREVDEVIAEFEEFKRKDVEDTIAKLRAIGALEPVPYRHDVLENRDVVKPVPEFVRLDNSRVSNRSPHSVLLFGPLVGPEAMGLAYIASFLRRHDIDVQIINTNPIDNAGARSKLITEALAYYTPSLVGVSLKWYHHIGRALEICHVVRETDPSINIVLGGNTATQFWRELITYDCVDTIIFGDGEVPMLELARRYPYPQNSVQ